jgi:hypothetical protein
MGLLCKEHDMKKKRMIHATVRFITRKGIRKQTSKRCMGGSDRAVLQIRASGQYLFAGGHDS